MIDAATPCPGCGASVYADAAFCHGCGKPLAATAESGRAALLRGFVGGALRTADSGARAVLGSPTAQKVAGGAIVGAGLAVFIPFVTMAAGATAGAALVGFKLMKKG